MPPSPVPSFYSFPRIRTLSLSVSFRSPCPGLPSSMAAFEMSSQRSDWRERLHANPSRMEHELALRLQVDRVNYLTQVEIPVTTADFYFPLDPRPLIVFIDGPVHLKAVQMMKDEDLRSLLRKRGYRILELVYGSYTDKKRDDLYREILNG